MDNFSPVWRSILPSYLKSAFVDAVVIITSKKHTVFSLNLDIICVSVIFMLFHSFMDSVCLSRIPKMPFLEKNTVSSVLFFAPNMHFWIPHYEEQYP